MGELRTHRDFPEEWRVTVRVLREHSQYGYQEIGVPYARAPRATFATGKDDAARQALSAWCHEYAPRLRDTAWKHYIRRPLDTVGGVIAEIPADMPERQLAQVHLTAALNTMLDDTLGELWELRAQMTRERKELRRLRAEAMGQNPVEEEEELEDWPARSPQPKRPRYGSPSSRTQVIEE